MDFCREHTFFKPRYKCLGLDFAHSFTCVRTWLVVNFVEICLMWKTFREYYYFCEFISVLVCVVGFQVVGGENSGRTNLGTIISSITPGGPADLNGLLKPGRRLIHCDFIFIPCCKLLLCYITLLLTVTNCFRWPADICEWYKPGWISSWWNC